MAMISGSRTARQEKKKRPTRAQPAQRAKRERPAPTPKIPAGWGNTAAFTGANNAQGISQASYAPPAQVFNPRTGQRGTGINLPNIDLSSAFNPRTGQRGSTVSFDQAIRNAFGIGAPAAAPAPVTPYSSDDAQRRFAIDDFISPGYQAPAISKNIAERYADWMNYDRNAELGYNSFLLPSPDFYSTDNTQRSGGGGGGYGGGGYGGGGYGGGGGGYGNDYNQWVRDLLTRWNI